MNETHVSGPRGQTPAMDAIDAAIGHRIRIERSARGITQTELATSVGISFQQLQKYEKGTNRITAGRLVAVAASIGIPVADLFGPEWSSGRSTDMTRLLTQPKAIKLLQLWTNVPSSYRGAILSLMYEMGKGE